METIIENIGYQKADIKVSIILPIYNCEKYLERCIESLLNQTYKNIEILAINDGSEDNSLNILYRYFENDKRIIIINKKNTGVSDSRNIALKKARGDYILFVDSDDWIDLNTIEDMVNISRSKNSDIVMCTYIREFKNHSKEKLFNLPNEVTYEDKELKILNRKLIGPINSEINNVESLDYLGTVWAKLYKKYLIDIEFVDLNIIGSAEDTLFNIFIFRNANKVSFINKPYYHYWKENEQSITSRYNPNLMKQWSMLFEYIRLFIEENDLEESFYEALNNRIAMGVLGLGLNECNNGSCNELQKIRRIKILLNYDLISKSLNKFNMKNIKMHWKVFYLCSKYKFSIGVYFMLNIINFLRKKF